MCIRDSAYIATYVCLQAYVAFMLYLFKIFDILIILWLVYVTEVHIDPYEIALLYNCFVFY